MADPATGAARYLDLIDPRWKPGGAMAAAGERHDEFEDLQQLLLDGATSPTAEVVELARTVARACLGSDHLWHDLGLPSRAELSTMLHEHFPELASRNTGGMRWKKFFYKQLCEQVGIRACRAPSCGVCAHYGECFGSEELPLVRMAA